MERPLAQIFRLTIAKKLLLGFLSYGILTILIALIALSNLRRLNEINNRIIERDVPLVEMSDKMVETLLAQELYGRRFFILKSPEMETLFWKRSEEFKKLLGQTANLSDVSSLPLNRLATLHEEYDHLFGTGLEKNEDRDSEIRKRQEELIRLLEGISRDARKDQNEKSLNTLKIGRLAFWTTGGLSVGALLLGIAIALAITRNISHSIHQLKRSTHEISRGKFDHLPEVRNRDELGDLSQAVQMMAQRLKRLEEMSLDANPLTHLPGSIAIEEVLKKRIEEQTPLAFCQLDLSHFKAFNDRYGYARGNEVILATARMVVHAVKAQGSKGSFVGHIGGDDFVVVTSPESYEKICSTVIDSFDKMVLDFYDPEDREHRCIQGETRQGQRVSFPIMTLAIAVVTNQHQRLENHVKVGEIAAELKNYAKSFSRSIFIVDRRKEGPLGQVGLAIPPLPEEENEPR
jgi:diguanylate cyclase (GGDEF)-like protein